MAADVKARRKALGLSRDQLARSAHVDKRILQLIELGQLSDEDSEDRLERVLSALEAGEEPPDLEAEVEALIEERRPDTLTMERPSTGDDGSNGV